MSNHTPTPWLWRKNDNVMAGWFGGTVFWVPGGTYQGDGDIDANARFIVKAVNAHDEAIELLTAVTQSDGNVSDLLFNQIQAALKKWGDA